MLVVVLVVVVVVVVVVYAWQDFNFNIVLVEGLTNAPVLLEYLHFLQFLVKLC